MRKLIPLLCLIPSLSWAAYIPGPVQVNNNAGTPNGVGYATGSSSMPVNVLNTVTVTPSGNINVNNTNVTSTITFNGTQNVQLQSGGNTVGFVNQGGAIWGATVTFNGSQNVLFPDGQPMTSTMTIIQGSATVGLSGVPSGMAYVSLTTTGTLRTDLSTMGGTTLTQTGGAQDINIKSGSIGNASFAVSTGGVTVTQATAGNLNATVAGTVTISTGGVNATQGGAWTVNVATGGVNVTGTVTVSTGGVTVTQATASNLNATVIGSLADNGAAAGTNRETTLPGIYQNNYLNGTAATQGRNASLSVGTDGNLWVSQQPGLRPAGFLTSTGTIASAASATDIACLYGNASNTVLVLGMRVSGTQTTAGVVQLDVIKRSAADVGVFSTMTVVAEDSTMNVGVSSTVWFTANPGTLGAAVGVVASYHLGVLATGTASPNDIWISPASWRQRPVVLRGVAQGLCANLNGVTVTGGSFDVSYEYEEITTISP